MQRRGIQVLKYTQSMGPRTRELIRVGEFCIGEVRINLRSLNSEGEKNDLVSEHGYGMDW